jgi:ribosomal protein S18 acetylase RimI-like enzyme
MDTMKSANVVLRRAVPGDAQAIGAVFDASVRVGWAFLGEAAQRPMFEPHQWDELVAYMAPPNVLLVATDPAGTIVGYSAVRVPEGEMFLLFVHPAHGGKGVGRALLEAAHDELRSAGCTEVFLFTEERNARARAVYEAAGYRLDGTVRDSEVNGTPTREVRMVRAL